MKCTHCNADLEGGAKFCTVCGQPVPEGVIPPDPETEPAKKITAGEILAKVKGFFATLGGKIKPALSKVGEKSKDVAKKADGKLEQFLGDKKMYLYAGVIGLVGLIIVISVIAAIIPNGNGYLTTQQVGIDVMDEKIYILKDSKAIELKTSAEAIADKFISIDGETILFLDDEGILHRVKGKKTVEIVEDVKDYIAAPFGNSVLFYSSEDDEEILYYTKTSKGKPIEVFESDDENALNEIAISPDGKSAAFTVYDDEGDSYLYYFNGKKSTKIKKCDGALVGLSNGGKYIYVASTNEDGKTNLYCYNKKGDSNKIGALTGSSVSFNLDGTEVMFANEDKTLVSVKGKEPIKVAKASGLKLMLPTNATQENYAISDHALVLPVESLFKHVYQASDRNISFEQGYTSSTQVFYITKKENKCIKLLSGKNISGATLDLSAEYIYYVDGDELMVLKISKGEKAEDKAKTIAEDVGSFVITSDRKYVYYIDDQDLYVVNGKKGGKEKKISKGDVMYLAIDDKDFVYYVDDESDVYATKGKKEGKRILSEGMIAPSAGIPVYAFDEDAIYATRGRRTPKKLLDIEFDIGFN
ncbi:MAG: zinc ribbon domain-containing protein [Clostridia bacterium]|nr:zinc ribbon domain-containing protein [Clostridia bacterium]